jgi:anti-sigma regulatory factor (Ser/Thr protein kinase)
MKFTKEIVNAIKTYIIETVTKHQNDILSSTVEYFHISKPTASKYINELIKDNILKKGGSGRYPKYQLVDTVIEKDYKRELGLEEDIIWREDFSKFFSDVPINVKLACQYGFTEILNNAIDHSESDEIKISLITNALKIEIHIQDYGIGIFNKIQKDLGLDSPKYAILELAKGKFTSDPNKHSGEGIFFTSRIFDMFAILSSDLTFFGHKDNDWLLENRGEGVLGTLVVMEVSKKSSISIADVFNEYTDVDMIPGFHKTIVPVQLMQYEGESLVSRSQAKRLITRFDRFLEVILDFTGVSIIGQAFADEVFRIFKSEHPKVNVIALNYNDNVKKMIEHVTGQKLD